MGRIKIGIVVAAMAVAALAGCSEPPKQGVVYDTEHTAAYSWWNTSCSAYWSNGTCMVYSGYWVNEPAHWRLCLMDKKNDLKGCREVDQVTFREYRIGDYYPKPQ